MIRSASIWRKGRSIRPSISMARRTFSWKHWKNVMILSCLIGKLIGLKSFTLTETDTMPRWVGMVNHILTMKRLKRSILNACALKKQPEKLATMMRRSLPTSSSTIFQNQNIPMCTAGQTASRLVCTARTMPYYRHLIPSTKRNAGFVNMALLVTKHPVISEKSVLVPAKQRLGSSGGSLTTE